MAWKYLQVPPLRQYPSKGNTETVQMVIKYSKDFGIDIHAKDNDGRTAWHMACFSCQTETAQLII